MTFKRCTIQQAVVTSVVMLAAACGAADESVEFGTSEEALSDSENCDTAPADAVHSGSLLLNVTSPSSYGSSNCVKGYLVDINDYVDYEGSLGAQNFLGNSARMIDVANPQSESECERLRVGAYVWRKNSNGSTTFVGGKNLWANWEPVWVYCDEQGNCHNTYGCRLPEVYFNDHFSMNEGDNYRVGVSARRFATPRDSGSSSTLRKVQIWNRRYLLH